MYHRAGYAPPIHAISELIDNASKKPVIVAQNSEKIDLLSVMNQMMLENTISQFQTQTRNVSARDNGIRSDLVSLDNEEIELHEKLSQRFVARDCGSSIEVHGSSIGSWPNLPLAEKRAYRKLTKPYFSSLDRQLQTLTSSNDASQMASKTLEPPQNEVKAFVVGTESNQLNWVANYSVQPQSVFTEPFRAPVRALRELVRDRLFLLDDHCYPCRIRPKHRPSQQNTGIDSNNSSSSSGSGSKAYKSSKEQLLQAAAQRIQLPPSGNSSSVVEEAGKTDEEAKRKQMALECALGRHAEGLADALLELVFKHCTKQLLVPAEHHSDSTVPADAIASEPEVNSSLDETDSLPPSKRRKKVSGSKQAAKEGVVVQEGIFTWRDVLGAVESSEGTAVTVHQDLPALPLSSTVRQRVSLRLHALLGGPAADPPGPGGALPQPQHPCRTVPAILQEHTGNMQWTPSVCDIPAQSANSAVPAAEQEGEGDAEPGSYKRKRKHRRSARRKQSAAVLPAVWNSNM